MSAFGVGWQTSGMRKPEPGKPADETVPETLIKWIPADAVAFYAGILAVGARQLPQSGSETPDEMLARIQPDSIQWFVFALGVTGALVVVGAKVSHQNPSEVARVPLLLRVVLTMVAFALWTTLLPGSWTYSLDCIRDMGAAYPLVIAVVTVIFTGCAEGLLVKIEGIDRLKVTPETVTAQGLESR